MDNAPPPLPPVRYGAEMLRTFGPLYRGLGLGVVMERMRFEDHSVERIRTAETRGPVVYVLLRQSRFDHLVLNALLNRRRLPLSVWADGPSSFWWQPTMDAWRGVIRRVTARWTQGRAPNPVTSA